MHTHAPTTGTLELQVFIQKQTKIFEHINVTSNLLKGNALETFLP